MWDSKIAKLIFILHTVIIEDIQELSENRSSIWNGFGRAENPFRIEEKLIQWPKMVEHPGCWSYFGTLRNHGPGRVQTNIFYLKTFRPTTKAQTWWIIQPNIFYLKNGLSHNLVLRIWGCYNEYLLLKWSFPLPHWWFDNIFYLKMVCRPILLWEFGAGIVNIFYLKWSFPLKTFQIEDIHIYYSCPPLPVQILQFRVQNLVFSCLPKAISNRRYSHIYYSCPPLPVQILQFRVQNLVFSCLPKAISNRRYSHILFLPTPASADSPISCAKLGVFMPSQSHFK